MGQIPRRLIPVGKAVVLKLSAGGWGGPSHPRDVPCSRHGLFLSPALCTLLHPQLHSSGFMAVGCWIQAGVQLLVSFLGGYLDYSAERQTSGITPN